MAKIDMNKLYTALQSHLINVVHFLLQHHRLLSQVSQTLARLFCLVVLIAQLGFVDCERFLLIGQGRSKIGVLKIVKSEQPVEPEFMGEFSK